MTIPDTTIQEAKRQRLFLLLCGIFLTNALIAEIIGGKIFSVETLLGLPPAQLLIGGQRLDFNMTAGVVNWPVVFITSDIINEYFGRKGVKRISFLTACFIAYTFITILVATMLPPAQFWLELNNTDKQGNVFNINDAFSKIFNQGLGIMIGSIVAFLLGQLLDVVVFSWLRRKTGSRYIWLRATGSTMFSQLDRQLRGDHDCILCFRELGFKTDFRGRYDQLFIQRRGRNPAHTAPLRSPLLY
jgi:uncharacterized integral membrane protein (TIGR00697 family)